MPVTPLRVAFDLDGTLVDFHSAYAAVEERLFGETQIVDDPPAPDERELEQHASPNSDVPTTKAQRSRRTSRGRGRHHEDVWRTIEATPNFWLTLRPLEEGVIERLYRLSCELAWEVFFITQRPATAGATVQWQTHKWLADHGFLTPSVIALSGGRGKLASALSLDYLVDDTPQNCVDVISDSSTRVVLLIDHGDTVAASNARRLGIATAHRVSEVLDLLTEATEARNNPSLFEKLRKLVGWV